MDQHIEIFDGSQEADFDSCVLNNFFDVRKEYIFTLLFVVVVVVVVVYMYLYISYGILDISYIIGILAYYFIF